MRKYLLALFFCLVAGPAWSQCNGVFGANQVCGSTSGGPPTGVAASAISISPYPNVLTLSNTTPGTSPSLGALVFSGGGFGQNQAGSTGTVTLTDYSYNRINIAQDQINSLGAPNSSTYGLFINFVTGGNGTAQGQKYAFRGQSVLSFGTNTTNGDVVGVSGWSISNVTNGGTNTGAGAKGTAYGLEGIAHLFSGALNYNVVSGGEIDVSIDTGASAKHRWGWSLVSNTTLQGAATDGALEIGAVTPAQWNNGILLDNVHGFAPLSTGGCVICTDGSSDTIATVIDLATYTISGNIFNFANFSVTGAGVLTAKSVSTAPASSSLTVAYSSAQSGHGTVGADNCTDCYDGIYTLNLIDVSSDDINLPSVTGAGVAALSIAYKWGGSNAHGERSPLYISSQWTANDATTSNPNGGNNVGATIIAQSNINAGGGTAGSGRGGNWALNPKCLMGASSVNMSTCSGAEVNIEVASGATVDNKIGWYIITTSGDAVQGRTINDAAYAFMTNGTVGFKCGYCASDLFTAKGPIATGGTFLGTEFASGPYTIAIGLDLTGFQNMTYQIKGKTFGVDGSGNIGGAGYVIVNSSLSVTSTGVNCSGTPTASFASVGGIVTHC